MLAFDAEGDIDDTNRFDTTAVDADGVSIDGLHRTVIQFGVTTEKTLTDASLFTSCVAQNWLFLIVNGYWDFCFVHRLWVRSDIVCSAIFYIGWVWLGRVFTD